MGVCAHTSGDWVHFSALREDLGRFLGPKKHDKPPNPVNLPTYLRCTVYPTYYLLPPCLAANFFWTAAGPKVTFESFEITEKMTSVPVYARKDRL
jgi:hypothetical protein